MDYTESSVEDTFHYALLSAAVYESPDSLALHPYFQIALRTGLDFLCVKVVEKSGLPWFRHRSDWSTVNYDISTVFRAVKGRI